jgi:ABC-type molybdate transport system substrate-binding protein
MAVAADVKVLSAGAVEPGLLRAAEQFERASGNKIKVQFNTAPQLTKRMAEGEVADILIAPPALLDEQAKNGSISTQGRLMLGRVGAGVVVRASAPNPDIATIEALKQAMLSADSIVYNTASSGLYLEKLFERNRHRRTNQGQDDALSQWRGCNEPHHQRQRQRTRIRRNRRNQAIRTKGPQAGRSAATGHSELYELRSGAREQCSFRRRGENISHISRHARGKTDFHSGWD